MAHLREEPDSPSAPLPLRTRHHHSSSASSSSSCFSSCFGRSATVYDDTPSSVTLSRSPSSWFRSKASEHIKCPNFISNIGKRRHHSADFKYDPLSYALNFDEGSSEDTHTTDDIRYRGFTARLPASPLPSRFPPVQPN
ncbi:hypothetical protein M5K25_025699 [Dendrobium thyrsiflorum]|uniref:Uncharacterized protein n=1 Tax=Dendrobium thyrsiflorum TaxID=117978 RepID=A0ABD0UA31_DENTH